MNTSTSNSHTSMSGSCTKTVDYTEAGEPLYSLAERRLRELVEAGNIEAIKLALALRPPTYEVTC